MGEVVHPAEGIYLSKFLAGVMAVLIAAGMIGAFTNLWYLNSKAIVFDEFILHSQLPDSIRPGALSRREWELERQIITAELKAINVKLDRLTDRMGDDGS